MRADIVATERPSILPWKVNTKGKEVAAANVHEGCRRAWRLQGTEQSQWRQLLRPSILAKTIQACRVLVEQDQGWEG